MYSNVFLAVRESLDFDLCRFLAQFLRDFFREASWNLLISISAGFWPSSFATFSARLADAEPPSIIIGKRKRASGI